MKSILFFVMYFFIYSFLGWVSESIYCSIGNKKIINRGFLNGPICPIYGIGAMALIALLRNKPQDLVSLFLCGIVLTSILEYMSGYILEKIFHTKWWDYSTKRFNIKGRVCLKNSIIFGFMSIILMKVIRPITIEIVENIPVKTLLSLDIVILGWFVVDIIITLMALDKLNSKLDRVEEIFLDLKSINISLDKHSDEDLLSKIFKYRDEDSYMQYRIDEIIEKLEGVRSKATQIKRIINAFPNMDKKQKHEQLEYLKEVLREKSKKSN